MKYIVVFIGFLCLVNSLLDFIDFIIDFILDYFAGRKE